MQWYDACKERSRVKMRLQIASVPTPAKLEPSGSNGKGVFGATFQEIIGTPESPGAGLSVMGQGWSGGQAQMGAPFTKWRIDKAIDESADEANLTSEAVQTGAVFRGTAKLTGQSEAIGGRIVPQTGTEDAPRAKEPATELALRDPTVGQPIVQNRTPPRGTPAQNEPPAAQITAGAMSPLSAASKDESQHATHKAEAMHDGTHVAADQGLSVVPMVPQPIDVVAPVTALQPGAHSAPPKSASSAMSSGVHGQAALRRAPTQPTISDQAELSGKSFAGLGSQTRGQAADTLAGEGREVLHRTPSIKTDASTAPQAAPLTEKSISATAVASATPTLQSKAAHHLAERIEPTASQMDARALKDAQGKPGTEVKSEVSLNVPVRVAPGSPAVPHQP